MSTVQQVTAQIKRFQQMQSLKSPSPQPEGSDRDFRLFDRDLRLAMLKVAATRHAGLEAVRYTLEHHPPADPLIVEWLQTILKNFETGAQTRMSRRLIRAIQSTCAFPCTVCGRVSTHVFALRGACDAHLKQSSLQGLIAKRQRAIIDKGNHIAEQKRSSDYRVLARQEAARMAKGNHSPSR